MAQSEISNPQSKNPKRRGAPKGNLNALKHGFYTSRFRRDELTAVDKLNPSSLSDEILFIRLLIRRLIDQSDDHLTYQERCSSMRVFCFACQTLTRLFKVQQVIGKDQDPFSIVVDAAVDQLSREWHLDDPDYYTRHPEEAPHPILNAPRRPDHNPEPSTLGQPEPSTLGQPEPSTLGQPEPSTLGQPEPSTLGQTQE